MHDSMEHDSDAAPIADRRNHARKKADALLYVGLGEDNGGIVLNLGEDGLEFHAAMGLQQNHYPRIRFQLPLSGRWAEAAGEIAWANESRTSAGLKFASLPEEAREEIRDWIAGHCATAEAQDAREEPAATPWFAPALGRQPEATVWEKADAPMEVEATAPVESGETGAVHVLEFPAKENQSAPAEISEEGAVSMAAEATGDPQAAVEARDEEMLAAAEVAREFAAAKAPALSASPESSDENFAPSASHVSGGEFGKVFEWERAREEPPKRSFSSWSIAGMLVGVAAISFAAGVAVGRRSLHAWIHEGEETPETETEQAVSSPAQNAVPPAIAQAPKPSSRPVSAGSSRSAGVAAEPSAPQIAGVKPSAAAGDRLSTAPPIVIATPATSGRSESVDLPEEPISASSTIAMSVTRSVEIPAAANGDSQAAPVHILPGEVISHIEPNYPADAIQKQVDGTVKLLVAIGKDGTIQQIEPMEGPATLVGTSVAAVQQWRFRPTLLDGNPAAVQAVVKIVFRLPEVGTSPANP